MGRRKKFSKYYLQEFLLILGNGSPKILTGTIKEKCRNEAAAVEIEGTWKTKKKQWVEENSDAVSNALPNEMVKLLKLNKELIFRTIYYI